MKTTSFRRKLIASAIATTALSGWSYGLQAQDAQDGPPSRAASGGSQMLEEIVVTGIRASMERAMDRKRYAQGVIDAISAEDMGDFPDTNLAESLQRITGVSIDRSDGEGSKVTVRGLGPAFNLVTLNGRQMPAANLSSGSRSFDFANLASEGVAAVEVYKTGRADVASGGMGATINIITPKPLTATPQRAITVQGVLDESRSSADLQPEISGIFSDSFFDGKFGVAVTGSWQEREGATNSARTGNGFFNFPGTVVEPDPTGEPDIDFADSFLLDFNNGSNFVNLPAEEDFFAVPQNIVYSQSNFERTRRNAQVTLQFAPVDSFVATLDYTYSDREIDRQTSDAGFWFNNQNSASQSAIFTDFESPAVQTPLVFADSSANDLAFGSILGDELFENESFGINLSWEATDRLRFNLDAHTSTAEVGPDDAKFGTSANVSASAFVRARTTAVFKDDNPTAFLDLDRLRLDEDGNTVLDDNFRAIRDPIDAVDIQDFKVSGSVFTNAKTAHDIDQIEFDAEWDVTDWARVKLGVGRIEGEFTTITNNVQNNDWGGLGDTGQFVGSDIFTEDGFLGKVEGDFADLTEEEAAIVGVRNTERFNQFFRADFRDVRDFAAANFDGGEGPVECFDGATRFCARSLSPSDPANNFNSVEEDIDYIYIAATIERELLGQIPYSFNLGFRYEETDVESPGNRQLFGPVVWVADNELNQEQIGSEQTPFQGDYDVTLPNIDFSINLRENVVFRASWSETLTRPDWLQLQGGSSFEKQLREDGGDGRRGNPGLSPIQSQNIDLSIEWYYGNSSSVTLAFFEKDVDDFIGESIFREAGAVPGAFNPAQGPRAQAARDAGLSNAADIREFIIDNFPDPETAFRDVNGIINIVGIPGEDPEAVFDVSQVSNEESASVDGWEFAVNHNFWDTGFGIVANYTAVGESTSFDNFGGAREPQFAVTGVSDSANLIAFYDKHGFQARVAYNWREKFLATTASFNGNNPITVADFAQVDANVSYQFTDNLTVFLEGINLNDAQVEQFNRADEQVLGVFESGPRFHLGVRYKF